MGRQTAAGGSAKKWWIIGGSVAGVILLAVLAVVMWLLHERSELTDENAQTVPTVQVSDAEKRQLLPKYMKLRKGVQQNKTVEEELTSEQLDQLIAAVDEFAGCRGRLSLKLDGEYILATVSVPLQDVPFLDGRYLNGTLKLKGEVSEGKLELRLIEGKTANGKAYPEWLVAKVNEKLAGKNLPQLLNSQWAKQLRTLSVLDGKLKLKTWNK